MENTIKISPKLVKGLNKEQNQAVSSTEGPLLVIAGPGSGKTKVLTTRIAAIIKSKLANPENILAMTFTNKAAAEMRERVKDLIGKDSERIWISTFHAAALRLLRINHNLADLPAGFTIIDSEGAKSVVSLSLKELGITVENEELKDICRRISRVKNLGLKKEELSSHPFYLEIKEIYDNYNFKLKNIATLDFDDILLELNNLLDTNKTFQKNLQNKFKYILVDEYQDTNLVQYKILQKLAPKNGNICVVGDMDQSIYAFRGSNPTLINKFTEDWKNVKTIALGKNYRSTPEIISICNKIISDNPATLRAELTTDKNSGEKVRLVTCYDDREEAKFIIKEITEYKGVSAILMRTNSQSRVFEEELSNKGIPYALVGALKFYERQEIKDILSYFKTIFNPRDLLSFNRSINVPRRGLGQVSINKITEYAKENTNDNLIAACQELVSNNLTAGKQREGILNYILSIEAITNALAFGPEFGVRAAIEEAGLRKFYSADKSEGPDRIANMEQLFESARSFSQGYENHLPESNLSSIEDISMRWLEHISLSASIDVVSDDSPQVYIMTVHSAKGKEYPNVYVIGLEENIFPYVKYGVETNEEEERRLFFVACSRAMEKLTLSWASRRYLYGRTTEQSESIFLKPLLPLLEEVDKQDSKKGSLYLEELRKRYKDPTLPDNPISKLRLTPSQIKPGAKVMHPVYGEGVIISGEGDYITTEFGEIRRVLKLSIAPLQLMSEAK